MSKRRKRVAFAAVLLLGVALLGWLAFALSPDVRAASAPLLGRCGADHTLAQLANDDHPEVRDAAVEAVVARGGRAVPALAGRLARPDEIDRVIAVQLVGLIGEPAHPALPELHRVMHDDPAPFVRRLAAQAVAMIGPDHPDTVPSLVRMLTAEHDDDREAAAVACRRLGRCAKAACPALLVALQDRTRDVRWEARKACLAIADDLPDDAPLAAELRTAADRAFRR